MKRTRVFLAGAVAILMAFSAVASEAEEAKEPVPVSDEQKVCYSLGSQIGNSLKRTGVKLDYAVFMRAIKDVLEDRAPAMTEEDMRQCMQDFQKTMAERQRAAREEEAAQSQAEEKAFLEENAQKDGVVVLPSGVQYKVIEEGEGPGPGPGPEDRVKVHYRGTFVDGKEFDSSYRRNRPAEFGLNQVIKGWSEALQLMKVGAKWEIYIPGKLAYGDQGRPGIGPNKMLIFEVQLLEIMPTIQTPAPSPQ